MTDQPEPVPYRTVGEWAFQSAHVYDNPFADVAVDATFTGPSGRAITIPAFYDGESTWRVRFNPGEVGRWTYRISSRPADPDLSQEGAFEAPAREARGFVHATPGRAWGFQYESGEPVLLLGDTVYNLFGMAHCGGDVDAFLQRRAAQGFNLLRVRVPVSPYHPPASYNRWQTRSTWPWLGSPQCPRFNQFNLDYFHTVDRVVRWAEQLGIGLEMIMEAWGFEFPFNSRHVFVPEWEDLWMRYLIARYDAYNSLYFWTPLNEYEYYPDGRCRHRPEGDRWAMRTARWIKGVARHGHVVAIHNSPNHPSFAERFAADPEAIDAIMFQTWGTIGEWHGWLAEGIENQIDKCLAGWPGSAVLAEYGYERNPELPLDMPLFEFCDVEHTRRGAWRGAFRALGIIHGFENTWGQWMILDHDQPGLAHLLHLRRFFTQLVPFHRLRSAQEIVAPAEHAPGHGPLALATKERDVVVVYLPTGGVVTLDLPGAGHDPRWFDPRTGELHDAAPSQAAEGKPAYRSPGGEDERGHPWDWVLLLTK